MPGPSPEEKRQRATQRRRAMEERRRLMQTNRLAMHEYRTAMAQTKRDLREELHEAAHRGAAPGVVWMRTPRPKPRAHGPSLSLEEIVRIAIELADAEGIGSVSMRRVASKLGAGAMSLYWYVASKEDLLDLMVDEGYAEVDPPSEPSDDWRADLRGVAEGARAVVNRHPWFAAVAASRPPLGPNSLRILEFALSALDRIGLDATAAMGMLATVADYVIGFSLSEVAEAEARRRAGLSEEQWRKAVEPYLQQVMESGRYPHFARSVIESDDTMSDDDRFAFGLDCLLDGIAARLPKRRARASRSSG